MSWGNPHALWWLLTVPVLLWVLFRDTGLKKKNWETFVHPSLVAVLNPELDWNRLYRKKVIWILAMIFSVLAYARPQWGVTEERVPSQGLDLMMVLDVSNSMNVEDVTPSRLKKAKHFLRNLADHLEGDRIGLVAFAGSSYLASPLTTDIGYLKETLQVVSPQNILNQGSDLGIGIQVATSALNRGAESGGDGESGAEAPSSPERVIILVSDGEDLEGQGAEAAQEARKQGVRIFTLGIGTEAGGQIPIRDERGQLHGYKRNSKGQPITSAFQSGDLKKIAEGGGGRYWTISPYENEMQDLLFEIGRIEKSRKSERMITTKIERFVWPLGLALLLIFSEMLIATRRGVGRRRGFEKTVHVGLGLICLPVVSMITASGVALAEESVPLKSFLNNEKALRVLQKNLEKKEEGSVMDLRGARKALQEAQVLDPERSELLYNEGLIDLAEEKWEDAAQRFQQSSRWAEKKGDKKVQGESLLNESLALEKLGKYREAKERLIQGVQTTRRSNDPELQKLEEELRKKLKFVEQQQQAQQKQQEQGQGDSSKSDSGESSEKEGDPKEEEKPSPQTGKPRDRFEGKRMKREDVERVMSELSGREQMLKSRLEKQKGQPQPNERDW